MAENLSWAAVTTAAAFDFAGEQLPMGLAILAMVWPSDIGASVAWNGQGAPIPAVR